MGRHADPTASARRFDPRVLLQPRLLVGAVVVLALAVRGIVWATSGTGDECSSRRTVRVAVAPEMAGTARALLAQPLRLRDGSCAVAAVSSRQPLQTVADLGALASSALPQVWVPDSSLWAARAGTTKLTPAGSLGWSPVVLGTSRSVADSLGWAQNPPSWAQALTGDHAVAVPDLATSAEGIAALDAVRASLGGGPEADNAVVQTVLAAERSPAVSARDAVQAARKGSADAPLVPVSEQDVVDTDKAAADSQLVAVYPSEGSPRLDYPVLRVGRPSAQQKAAVDAVVARLTSAAAHDAAHTAGLRDARGRAPAGAGIRAEAPGVVALDPAQVRQLMARLASLAKPSRILAVFDVSTSMRATVGDGTRVTLARDAAKSALTLVPDTSAIGLWDFAYHLNGHDDWTELLPTRPLGATANGTSQRQALTQQLDSLPDRLAPGGTGLYDTTLAAVRSARSNYDPAAVNSVLLVTDGANDDDPGGIALPHLLDTLKSEADPSRPVKVIGVALGPDADQDALEQIASATGGAAYSAVDPRDLQTVLFDALRQRS